MEAQRFSVHGGEHSRQHVVVRVPGLGGHAPAQVVDESSGVAYPAQADGDDLVFVLESLEAGSTRTFSLHRGEAGGQGTAVEEDNQELWVTTGGTRFARFLHGPEYYRPHFYPVLGPGGVEVTETGPADHVHHRSLYVAYGEVNGADCWSEGKNAGRVVLQELNTTSGPVFAEIATRNRWQNQEGTPLLSDEQIWRFYNLPESRRIIDVTVRFHATHGDVHFGDTKEGGILSVRVAPSIRVRETGRIENSYGGINEAETWGRRAQWCDYSGFVNGVHVGIAVLDHLDNPRHPCHWHVRNYGLMTTNVFGRGTFERGRPLLDGDGSYTLSAGETLTFRYRVVVHAGDAHDANIAGAYHDFVFPPSVHLMDD